MTIGRPLPLILQFSIPLLLGIIFQQFYNLIDTIIVGRFLGIEALSAVGASTPVMFLIIEFCTTCCSSFSIPVAQEFGVKNYSKMRSYVSNSAYFSIVLAAFLTAVTMPGCRQMLVWIRTPADIFKENFHAPFDTCKAYCFPMIRKIPGISAGNFSL